MEIQLLKIQYIKGESIVSLNTGQTPLLPHYIKTFFDPAENKMWSVTDLDIKKHKRTNAIREFRDYYTRLYSLNKVSLFSAVVNQEYSPKIGKFLNTISKKLSRKGVKKLGHVWIRDIGEIKFQKHYHVLIATDYVNQNTFNDMFSKKHDSKYEIEYVITPNGISRYLTDKELYAANRERAFQKSLKFSKPKAS
jgi:hypothetical protein